MKHILRKLHIGSSQDSFDGRTPHDVSAAAAAARVLDGGPQLIRADPVGQIEAASPSTPLTPDQRASSGFSGWFANARHARLASSSSTQSNARSRLDTPTTNAVERISEAQPSANFNYYEEEYQVQLALALSVSNQSAEDDPEALQIRAAKRISLGRPPSPGNTPAEFTAHRYWNYNVLDYAEKVMDGFYDVYGVVSDFGTSEKMPSLVDLQATPLTDTLGYEVVLVNRTIDQDLVQLEQAALCLAVDCGVNGLSPQHSGLVQKIADLVVQHMGGPVVDANDMLRRWRTRSYELRTTLNNIVLPLGCLQIGLSRHRALLFKVLADHVGIPCRLVKGSHYTGTDEGAVNIVKLDDEREYIVDLMGAPGTLLPAEIVGATDVFENTALVEELFSQLDSSQNISFPDKNPGEAPEQCSSVAKTSTGVLEDCTRPCKLSKARSASKMNEEVNVFGSHGSLSGIMTEEFRMIKPALSRSGDSNGLSSDASVNISAVGRDPAAESLAAVSVISEEAVADVAASSEINQERLRNQGNVANSSTEVGSGESGTQIDSKKPNYLVKMSLGEKQYMDRWTKHVNNKGDPVLENVAEWEIPWEEIVIGERIGLGSYGEVHHGDWHGKEVAVKRFLDQDFSGDALDEFISEVRIMRRMQHPNVVLFLGAVTRPPNLSIVTEYLPRGSLFRLLHRPNCQLDERRRLKMALDVAEGMNYLHTSMPIIVHRDLKSPNLLVDKNWVVKVCDFGLSRLKHHTFLSSKSTAGTPEWMAPEVLRNEPSNEKCDVYSFGVILWELATLEAPWSGMNPMQVVGAVGFQNRRLEIPKNLDHSVARIIRDCWQSDPSLRPSFSEITVALKPLQRLLKDCMTGLI